MNHYFISLLTCNTISWYICRFILGLLYEISYDACLNLRIVASIDMHIYTRIQISHVFLVKFYANFNFTPECICHWRLSAKVWMWIGTNLKSCSHKSLILSTWEFKLQFPLNAIKQQWTKTASYILYLQHKHENLEAVFLLDFRMNTFQIGSTFYSNWYDCT